MSNSFSSDIRFNSSVWIGTVSLFVGVIIGFTLHKSFFEPEAVVQQEVTAKEEKMVDVLVPLQDIQSGTRLQPSMFKKIQKPEPQVDERVIRNFEGIVNMYSKTTLVANTPVMQDYIVNRTVCYAEDPIPAGYRAIMIRVISPAEIRAGSKVDVNWFHGISAANQHFI